MSGSLHMESSGMYGVLLHNREDCTDSEIKSLVSQFGKIREYRRVPKSGADLVFVHYEEYEEARACLEQLERDPMFYAMPARPREGRLHKPASQRDHAKSLDRVTNASGRTKSILRSRSVLAEKANQIESSTSSNEEKQADELKEVRFVRPGESSPIRRSRRSRPRGSGHLPGEFSLSEEFSQSGDRPPHLLNLVDVWTKHCTEEAGVLTSTEVIIYDIPLHFTDGQIFALCDRFVNVLSVEVDDFQFNKIPFKIAVIQVRSPDDARLLKKCLHRRALKGKILKVVFSADFY